MYSIKHSRRVFNTRSLRLSNTRRLYKPNGSRYNCNNSLLWIKPCNSTRSYKTSSFSSRSQNFEVEELDTTATLQKEKEEDETVDKKEPETQEEKPETVSAVPVTDEETKEKEGKNEKPSSSGSTNSPPSSSGQVVSYDPGMKNKFNFQIYIYNHSER